MWFYNPNDLIVLEKERIQHEENRKINSPIKKEITQETQNKKPKQNKKKTKALLREKERDYHCREKRICDK